MSVADPREGPGGVRPPLFLDQTEAWRAEKKIFGHCPPLFSGSGWPAPPSPIWRSGSATVCSHWYRIAFRADMNDDVNSYGTELQRVWQKPIRCATGNAAQFRSVTKNAAKSPLLYVSTAALYPVNGSFVSLGAIAFLKSHNETGPIMALAIQYSIKKIA